MKFARRIEQLPPYLFVEISRKIAQKRAEGIDVVTFAIGDPDIPTPSHILDRLPGGKPGPSQPSLSGVGRPAGASQGRCSVVRGALWSDPGSR